MTSRAVKYRADDHSVLAVFVAFSALGVMPDVQYVWQYWIGRRSDVMNITFHKCSVMYL